MPAAWFNQKIPYTDLLDAISVSNHVKLNKIEIYHLKQTRANGTIQHVGAHSQTGGQYIDFRRKLKGWGNRLQGI